MAIKWISGVNEEKERMKAATEAVFFISSRVTNRSPHQIKVDLRSTRNVGIGRKWNHF